MQISNINPSTTLRIDGERSRTIKYQNYKSKFKILHFALSFWILIFGFWISRSLAQGEDLEFTLDVNSHTIPLPKIFRPNIDLSGRGLSEDMTWPQTLAAKEVLETWQRDIGFSGLYRIQYNLWEMQQLYKNPELQNRLFHNYENIIKAISEAGGIVILDLYGTPADFGKVLDKKSPPRDLKAFKELVKSTIRNLSCNKRYNIWYEVWSAPDLDGFFLGRTQEYLNLYRAVAESVNELKAETKIFIPLGGPGVSWWFQSPGGNSVVTAQNSLIYELIKFCYHYRLPLDFISWHSYTTNPQAEKENTVYKKTAAGLIRDWLSYFNFDRDTPLVVDEWNYDRDANVLPERKEKSHISASYIPSRIRNMHEAGINYQLYFCLEDFQNDKEAVVRNTGVFSYDALSGADKVEPKATYNCLRMLDGLGGDLYASKFQDDFVGVIATRSHEDIILLVYNYIDPDIVLNLISNSIANFKGSERRFLLDIVRSDKLRKILLRQLEIAGLRTTNRVKALLKKARDLNDKAKQSELEPRNININIKNLKDDYLCLKFTIDSSCGLNCEFAPAEQKEFVASGPFQEALSLEPYSVHLLVLTKQPKKAEPPVIEQEQGAASEEPKESPEITGTKEQLDG